MGAGGSKRAVKHKPDEGGPFNGDAETELQDSHKMEVAEIIWEEVLDGGLERRDSLGQWNVLPDECVLRILSLLPIKDIFAISCASKTFFMFGRDEFLWKTLYQTRGISRYCRIPEEQTDDFLKDKSTKVKRKGRGKWRSICLKNLVMVQDVEVILNEQMLGWPFERVEDLFGQFDEVTNVGRGSCYYFFHSVGLSVCCEDARVSSVLRHTPVGSCPGSCYEKIVPLS